MKFIYYNVSGEYMEILQFLLSFFLSEYGGGKFAPVFELLKENSFDIGKTLKSLDPKTVAPIVKDIFSSAQNKSPTVHVGSFGLSPVKNIADKEIVYTLNKYLCD